MSAAAFLGWAAEALIASSLLMVFVLLIRQPAQRALGPQLAYWLWALPLLRMAMPPLPAGWRASAAAPISAASETVLVLVQPIVTAGVEPAAAPLPWLAIVAATWGVGALAFFGWHGLSHFSYVGRIVAPPARHERLPDGTTLVKSDEAIGPVAFGVLRRFVAVPTDFAERYDADERKLALAHELGHHARGDLIANWIALAMLAIHWFNPLAWVAYRKFRSDQEMANDARVLTSLPPIERHAYACAIVKAAHGRAVTAACHLHTIEDLKGRLRMLKASRKSRRVVMAGAVGIASLTVAGLGLTASGVAAEQLRTVAETQVVAMAQAVPVTPMPPAAVPATDPDVPPVPMAERTKIVIVRDGRTETYEGSQADAYVAAHPDIAGQTVRRETRRSRLVLRGPDGKARTYEGAEAEAYLKTHPELRPPLPPLPPLPAGVGAIAPPAPKVVIGTAGAGGALVTRSIRTGPGAAADAAAFTPEVISGDCRGGDARELVRNETRNGKPRLIVCEKRIERFAAAQARYSKSSALLGLNAGRAAILSVRDLSDDQRRQALAGIDQARQELEREIRKDRTDD